MSGSNPNIRVQITAQDTATRAVNALANRIAAINLPARNLQNAFRKLGDVSGVTKVAEGMRSVERSSLRAFEAINHLGGPMAALSGAAAIAGIVKLSSEWANYGTQLQFAARRTGTTVDRMSALQGAARLAGSSTTALTSGMTTLRDNLVDINAGRAAPMLVAAFDSLKVSWKNATGGVRDANEVLPELADKIKAIRDPTMQAIYATQIFGGAGEELLPFLKLGREGIERYNQMATHYGAVNEKGAAAANELRMKQVELTLAVEGLGNSIAEVLAPAVGPIVHDFAEWLNTMRPTLAQDLKGWITTTAPELKTFGTSINTVAQAFGGWKNVLEDLLILRFTAWAAALLLELNPVVAAITAITAGILLLKHHYEDNTSRLDKAQKMGVGVEYPLMSGDATPEPIYKSKEGVTLTPEQVDKMWDDRQKQGGGGEAPAAPGASEPVTAPTAPAGSGRSVRLGSIPADVEDEIRRKARATGLDPDYMVNLARVEQGGYTNVSKAGAIGPMQLMPGTAKDLGVNPYDWHENVSGGLTYFARLLKKFGSYEAAAAAYNAGPGRKSVQDFATTHDPSALPWETQDYVRKLNGAAPMQIAGGGAGSGAGNQDTKTVRGSASLKVTIDSPVPVRTSMNAEGDLWDGRPRVEHVMAG